MLDFSSQIPVLGQRDVLADSSQLPALWTVPSQDRWQPASRDWGPKLASVKAILALSSLCSC